MPSYTVRLKREVWYEVKVQCESTISAESSARSVLNKAIQYTEEESMYITSDEFDRQSVSIT